MVYFGIESYQSEKRMEAYKAETAKTEAAVAALASAMPTAPPPPLGLSEACAGKGVKTTSVLLVIAAVDAGAKGLPADLATSYIEVSLTGAKFLEKKYPGLRDHVALVRVLEGTEFDARARSYAKLHVRVFKDPKDPMVCEGLAEGYWTGGDRFSLDYGLGDVVMSGLCAPGEKTDACGRLTGGYPTKFTKGPLPAPSTSASGSSKAPPRPRGAPRK
jgi:hypothetical protein